MARHLASHDPPFFGIGVCCIQWRTYWTGGGRHNVSNLPLSAICTPHDQVWPCQWLAIHFQSYTNGWPVNRYSAFLAYYTTSTPQTTSGLDVPYVSTLSMRSSLRLSNGLIDLHELVLARAARTRTQSLRGLLVSHLAKDQSCACG
jgi:hypothetical protein